MGLPDDGNATEPPEGVPVHTVNITEPVLMSAHEVTIEQFQSVMGKSFKMSKQTDAPSDSNNFPVTNITWKDAVKFCSKLSDLPEEKKAGRTYRLPTEAEWEYACRAGKSQPYDWNSQRKANDVSGEAAGIIPALPIAKVGSYPPNEFGLYDMRGNAWEWTADWFDRDYYSRSPQNDPQGPAAGFLKVVRGGDWRFIGEGCLIDYPIMPPWKTNPVVGFRVVCDLVVPPESINE